MKQLTPASPHVIVMVGIPGAGKSAFAGHFAETFKTPYVNQSHLMREFSISPETAEHVSYHMLDEIMKTRRTLIYEGSTATKPERLSLIKYIVSQGYRPLMVWVQTDTLEAKRRATKEFPKGSGLTPSEFDQAVSAFESPIAKDNAIVISGKHTYASQLKIVLKQLASDRPEVKIPTGRSAPVNRRSLLQ